MLNKELFTVERVQPRFIEPMYAEVVRELPDGGIWSYEAKLDGYRCLAAKRSGDVVLRSRRGNGFTARFPEIARACEKLPDGERLGVFYNGWTLGYGRSPLGAEWCLIVRRYKVSESGDEVEEHATPLFKASRDLRIAAVERSPICLRRSRMKLKRRSTF